ncbi:MAG: hypothetical protein RIQ81_133 [Pseudomonadota bacterium]
MKQLKTAGLLAAALLVLGGIATWDEWQTKKDDKKKETEKRLLSIEPEKITALEFLNQEGKDPVDISFEKKDGKWQILRPTSLRADQQAVDNLLTTLRDYKFEQIVDEATQNPGAFGLDKPRRVIKIKSGEAETILKVGSNAPVGYSVYAMIDGSPKVYVGSQYLAVSTGKSLHDLRDKSLLAIDTTTIKTVELTRPGQSKTVLEKADGTFGIVKPEVLPADQTAVRNFVDDIAKANALAFDDAPSAATKKLFSGKLLSEVRLAQQDGTQTTIKFIEQPGKLKAWAGGNSPVVELSSDFRTKISKSSQDFRDRKVFNLVGDKVSKAVVDGKSFEKKNGDWFPAGDDKNPATKVRALIVDLEFLKASEILSASDKIVKESTSGAPAHSLKLTLDGQTDAIEVSIWEKKNSPESYILKHSASKAVFVVGKSSISAIESATKGDAATVTPNLGSSTPGDDAKGL